MQNTDEIITNLTGNIFPSLGGIQIDMLTLMQAFIVINLIIVGGMIVLRLLYGHSGNEDESSYPSGETSGIGYGERKRSVYSGGDTSGLMGGSKPVSPKGPLGI